MRYQNGKQYEGVFNGIAVTFTLHGFSEKVVDEFNRRLADEARVSVEKIRPIRNQTGVSAL